VTTTAFHCSPRKLSSFTPLCHAPAAKRDTEHLIQPLHCSGLLDRFTVVTMVYQHNATRSATTVDTESGAGGACTGSNLGMPRYQTNMMSVCTRQLIGNDTLDVTVPGLHDPYLPDAKLRTGPCSMSSADVPWFDGKLTQSGGKTLPCIRWELCPKSL
jgi:hypothetical protein